MNFTQDKVKPIPLRCVKVVFLENVWKDESRDVYFCLSSFCGYLAMKSSILRGRNNLNLTFLFRLKGEI